MSRISSDGAGREQSIEGAPGGALPYCWSADGKRLAIQHPRNERGWDVSVLDLDRGEERPVAATAASEWGPYFSPACDFISFVSDRSGRYEIYVSPLDGSERVWTVSSDGGEEPIWSRDGRELFYRNGNAWMRVPVTTHPSFSAGRPEVIFEGPYLNVGGRSYDVSADAQRFLVIRTAESDGVARELKVVFGWTAELARLVPRPTGR